MKTTKRLLCLLVVVIMAFSACYMVACGSSVECDYVSYDRAGYGNISFRSDFGPTMYTGVRQAISYTIDTATFAQDFTGGYGTVVYGPFGTTTAGYVANADVFNGDGAGSLTQYSNSQSSALDAVIDAGFTYNSKGEAFDSTTDTIRYVKLEDIYLTDKNIAYASVEDSDVCTVKVGDYYYMPLVINWYGSTPNDVTDMLVSYWQTSTITAAIGMVVTQTTGDFTPLLAELYQYEGYGWDGTYVYVAFNLATGFTSSIYDYSWSWTIDPDLFDNYSAFYLMDEADFVITNGYVSTGDTYSWGDYDASGGGDYMSQWDMYGSYLTDGWDLSVDDVFYNDDGMPCLTIKGDETELGMDFLSMAMVYATDTSDSLDAESEYYLWFQYYCVRWNMLMPSIPLYSNVYYDVYDAQISDFQTTAYWAPSDAIVNATTSAEDSTVLMGSSTELAGDFQLVTWASSSTGASDQDISGLITGYSTLSMDTYGAYAIDDNVVEAYTETDNADGTTTFTVTITDGLKFNDGSAITAENYLIYTLVNSTAVAKEASGSGTAGMYFTGFSSFLSSSSADTFFSGVKMSADKMTYSVTVSASYLPYYYAYTYAGMSPYSLELFFGSDYDSSKLSITLDDTGVTEGGVTVYACGLSSDFFAMTGSSYDIASTIKAQVYSTDGSVPTAGPYMLTESSWDETSKSCVLEINPYFTGEANRNKPTIEYVGIVYVTDETMIDMLSTGLVDMLNGITGGDVVDAALALCPSVTAD